ncbi:hypothetical protein KC327_g85 [Hortaea werneckii]|nr:hypothetical protein KC327_g85 [Hortaea werneckii]
MAPSASFTLLGVQMQVHVEVLSSGLSSRSLRSLLTRGLRKLGCMGMLRRRPIEIGLCGWRWGTGRRAHSQANVQCKSSSPRKERFVLSVPRLACHRCRWGRSLRLNRPKTRRIGASQSPRESLLCLSCLSCLGSRVGATCHRVIARRWTSGTSTYSPCRSTRRRTFSRRFVVYPYQAYTEQCYNHPRQSSPPSHPSSTTTTPPTALASHRCLRKQQGVLFQGIPFCLAPSYALRPISQGVTKTTDGSVHSEINMALTLAHPLAGGRWRASCLRQPLKQRQSIYCCTLLFLALVPYMCDDRSRLLAHEWSYSPADSVCR